MGHLLSTFLESVTTAEHLGDDFRRPTTVPTEIVHRIVSFVIAAFLDDLLAECLALSLVCVSDWRDLLRAKADTHARYHNRLKPGIDVKQCAYSTRIYVLS